MDNPVFLMENNQFYTQVFQSSPVPMSITDPATGRYVDVNEAFLKALGYQREEVIAKTALELGVFYDPRQRTHLLEKMKLQGSLQDEEVQVRGKSGELRWWLLSAEPIAGREGLLLLSAIQDITRLREAEARWQYALEGAGDGVWDWNAQTNRVFYSNRWKSMLGYAPHEIGDTLDEWKLRVHPDDLEGVLAEIEKHFSGQAPQYSSEHRIRCKDGQYKWILDRGQVIQWTPDHCPLRVIGTHSDITRRKNAEEALRRSEQQYRELVEALDISLCRWKPDTTLVYANEKYCQIFGIQGEPVGRRWLELLPLEERQELVGFYAEIASHPRTVTSEYPMILADGQPHYFQWIEFPILDPVGKLVEFQSVCIDTTERNQAEQAVQQLLREKELLLREVHHRIKNNMSTIISLLNMQASSFSDQAAVQALEEASQRVRSMLAIYDLLYRGSDFQRVNLKIYMERLLDGIAATQAIPGSQISLVKRVEAVEAPVSLSFPLGILVNELVTNAYKYAFSGRSRGQVCVTILRRGTDLEVSVADDGIGLPEGIDTGAAESFGLGLVNIIAQQLHVELQVERAGGTKFTLLMPLAGPG
jgi:PAS domain S-box-containing protein